MIMSLFPTRVFKRGVSPLKLPRKESQREAKPLLINYFPLPLLREGGRGIGC
jgi:hypothetical protein